MSAAAEMFCTIKLYSSVNQSLTYI